MLRRGDISSVVIRRTRNADVCAPFYPTCTICSPYESEHPLNEQGIYSVGCSIIVLALFFFLWFRELFLP
jgi:hypothetical protein